MRVISGTKRIKEVKALMIKKDGSRIANPADLVVVCAKFADEKFQPTELEKLRVEFDALPENKDPLTKLQRKEFEDVVNSVKMTR